MKQITLSVTTETLDNLSETYQNTLPEIQVDPCRTHQKTKQNNAGTSRDFIKSMQAPSDFHQNPYITHQNLNNTYARSIRTSTKTYQNLNKTMENPIKIHQESIKIPTIPMQNPSELQQKTIRISTKPVQNPSELQQNSSESQKKP